MNMLRDTLLTHERAPARGQVPAGTRRWARLAMIAVTTAVVLAGGATVYVQRVEEGAPVATPPPPPVPVIATTVQKQDFPIVLTGIGNVTALNTATVRAMVTEQIVSIAFKDGQFVKKGELLARLDPRTFQAQLDQAKANLANANATLERVQGAVRSGAVSKQELDQATAAALVAQAQVLAAKTQLSYTELVAPFDGVAGIRLLDVGNIIHASTSRGFPGEPNALVVVNQVQPISVVVTLAAAEIPKVQDALAKGSVKVIALSADGRTELDTGTLAAIDNQASTTSGTINLKAIFPNPNRRLWPGMFVNVRVVTSVQDNGLTVPLEAVQQGPQGQYVFVVGRDHKVSMQAVSVSETLNGEALIDKGLSAGEIVVRRGQYRLTPGTVVSLADPNNPAAVPNPTAASAGLLP